MEKIAEQQTLFKQQDVKYMVTFIDNTRDKLREILSKQ